MRAKGGTDGGRSLPEVVLFDLGGVLMDFGGPHRLADLTGQADGPALRSRWAASPWVQAFERGACDTDAFARAIVQEWDLDLTPGEFVDEFRSRSNGPFPGAVDLVRLLQGTVQLGCLTNTNAVHWQHLDRWGIVRHFDWTFASHQTGLAKPDAEAFRLVSSTLDVTPDRLLFFDDSLDNVQAARRAGMQAEHTRGLRQVLDALALHVPADSDAGRRLRARNPALGSARTGRANRRPSTCCSGSPLRPRGPPSCSAARRGRPSSPDASARCKLTLYAASEPLLVNAQAAGTARTDVGIDDVLRFIMGVTSAPARSCEQRDRFVRLAVDAFSST